MTVERVKVRKVRTALGKYEVLSKRLLKLDRPKTTAELARLKLLGVAVVEAAKKL